MSSSTESDSTPKLVTNTPVPRSELDRTTIRWIILCVLFFVTGFLGLPVLWVSKSFSLTEKIIWSVVNIVYTSTLIAITAAICWWAFRPLFAIVP
jgi:hypothetical protein